MYIDCYGIYECISIYYCIFNGISISNIYFSICRKQKTVVLRVMHYFSRRMNVQYCDIGLVHGLQFVVQAVFSR